MKNRTVANTVSAGVFEKSNHGDGSIDHSEIIDSLDLSRFHKERTFFVNKATIESGGKTKYD